MRHGILLLLALGLAAQTPRIPENHDESKVGTYTLPDPLTLANGQPVRAASTWLDKRRPEILRLFESEVYGRSPGKPRDLSFEVTEKNGRKQVVIYFSANKNGPRETMLLHLPPRAAKPVPLILALSFVDNETIATQWPVEKILARGIGLATIHYTDIEPDRRDGLAQSVRSLYLKPGQTETAPDEWGAIAAWGWGLSRAMDYIETDPELDATHVAIMGHSRLGKTVLWAGARDTRFFAVIANNSGEGGASLARRNYGETIRDLNRNFPWWFAGNYRKYSEDPSTMPVDTHELIALIAPRPVYLATAEEDRHADPKGEFLAAVAAEPVYKLFGRRGLEVSEMPPLNSPIQRDIAFHYRTGKHDVTPYDWDQYIAFAATHLKTAQPVGRGIAQHPFLYCGEWQDRGHSEQIMHVVRDGKVVWTHSIPGREEYGDCTMLSNGNIVFSRRLGASEITPDKKIVWNYDALEKTEIHTAYPLGLDRVLIMQNGNPAKLLVIHKASGRVEKELVVPARAPDNVHGQFRHVRVTSAGTFLVAHLDLGKVVEYDAAGKQIWSVDAPSAWAAVRLKNGNTLISGNQHGYVREVNPKGEVVWEINKWDLPGIVLQTVQEVDRLANGNTVICNWAGGLAQPQWANQVQVIEVTPDKRIVWALRDWKNLGPASSIQLLDEPGIPEKGELQR